MAGPVELIITNNNLPLLQQLDPLMKLALRRAMNEIGEDGQATAVKAIQNQVQPDGTPWTQLQDWWVAWKKAKGYSEQIYIMTSSYIQAITWKTEETVDDMQTVIGVMRGVYPTGATSPLNKEGHQSEDKVAIELWSIAEILEYGWEQFNVKIPPRPLWRPTVQTKKRVWQSRIGTAVYWATKKIAAQAKGSVAP